ncbi:hypothetical protein C1Y40_02643 [Mycobacterium talmoniae]|uniref:Uncharacterized protein n=1 Tax=Mycobacterium talmoniae TaxID=1858794 RepID=A0A2S8BKG1_9MYCO|nr:hypothetical protein C1Y40_02643 [Mycobacterium talmoniae]
MGVTMLIVGGTILVIIVIRTLAQPQDRSRPRRNLWDAGYSGDDSGGGHHGRAWLRGGHSGWGGGDGCGGGGCGGGH